MITIRCLGNKCIPNGSLLFIKYPKQRVFQMKMFHGNDLVSVARMSLLSTVTLFGSSRSNLRIEADVLIIN